MDLPVGDEDRFAVDVAKMGVTIPEDLRPGLRATPQARWPPDRSATAIISTLTQILIARHRIRRLHSKPLASVVTGQPSLTSWMTFWGTTRCSATDRCSDSPMPTQTRPPFPRAPRERTLGRPPAPPASSAAATAMGQANRGRDTAPELRLRSALHRRGRGSGSTGAWPRIYERLRSCGRVRVAVFVDGCFSHRCSEHSTVPKANCEWWASRLEENWARARRADVALRKRGWTVIRVWEHDDPEDAARRVAAIVQQATMGGTTK